MRRIKKLVGEQLENREVLSLTFGFDDMGKPPGTPGGGPGDDPEPDDPAPGPAIDLFTVALHEFGHSLGLGHAPKKDCKPIDPDVPVMCASYRGAVSGLHADDIAAIQALYNSGNPWGKDEISYSFVDPDIDMSAEEPGLTSSSLAGAFSGVGAGWQTEISTAAGEWQSALVSVITLSPVGDSGYNFDAAEASGDIRIAAHAFDGSGGVLAHAYFPPPDGSITTGGSSAGDLHFDEDENWQNLNSAASSASLGLPSASTSPPVNAWGVFDLMIMAPNSVTPGVSAGDANRDGAFDRADLIQVLNAGKYSNGDAATWSEGDWNGDGVFNQLDIVMALHTGTYQQGSADAVDAYFSEQ